MRKHTRERTKSEVALKEHRTATSVFYRMHSKKNGGRTISRILSLGHHSSNAAPSDRFQWT